MTFDTWYAAECERLHALPDGQRESWVRAAWEAATKRCAEIAHGYFLTKGPPVAPLGSHLAVQRAAGADIANAINQSGDDNVNSG